MGLATSYSYAAASLAASSAAGASMGSVSDTTLALCRKQYYIGVVAGLLASSSSQVRALPLGFRMRALF